MSQGQGLDDQPQHGIRVFAISGTLRRGNGPFLAYGLEYLDGAEGAERAVIGIPPRPRWRWLSQRLFVVRGRDAEEIRRKLTSCMEPRPRLVWLDEQRLRPCTDEGNLNAGSEVAEENTDSR